MLNFKFDGLWPEFYYSQVNQARREYPPLLTKSEVSLSTQSYLTSFQLTQTFLGNKQHVEGAMFSVFKHIEQEQGNTDSTLVSHDSL